MGGIRMIKTALVLLVIAAAATAAPTNEDSWTQTSDEVLINTPELSESELSPKPLADDPKITDAFTSDEIKECHKIRTPYLETSGSGYYHLWAICCGKNLCGGKRRSIGGLGDDHSDARVVMKTSTDRGHSWGKAQFLTDVGYANAKAIFDEKRNTLVVQYGKNSPARVYQITSKDHGKTWSKQVEIKEATECGGGGVGGGGQRTMTESGRMLWYSDAPGCIWYSDDGGKTYKSHKGVNGWNEASFVSIAQHSIYANGRAHDQAESRQLQVS